ncbi:MAG: DUF3990 domain-containing protein [Bacteroidales bacterium]|nr:DUF3990 domain-containing protein [Bacteroidales bacterium]
MIVYHGSYCIIERPDVSFSREKLDFGKVFYVTTILKQAERWCEKFLRKGLTAYINVYDFNESILNNAEIKVKKFDKYDSEWLDYVAECRKGNVAYHQYDIVIGGVANDQIFATIDAYFAGYMNKEVALEKLKYEKPNQQICFLNQLLLNQCISFIKAEKQ